ncbi:hypothetical protein AB6A40_002049 [Gnathostoma spinigerum]|uniref:PX domain-containing protein n=1 Tax=Gnathostoma spinigerum TaxID=75299 RepID=A0ABD6E6N2_9BILA
MIPASDDSLEGYHDEKNDEDSKLTDDLSNVDLRIDDEDSETSPSVQPKLAMSITPEEEAPPSPAVASAPSLPSSAYIDIKINQFEKKGEGMNAYIVYKIVSKVQDVVGYANKEYEVWRRFSDFLGLHEKLMEKHFHRGIMVPAAPEKSISALTKTKMTSGPDDRTATEFAERRARILQRFCMRIARHPVLISDCDFRDFLTLASPLPKATSTAALSGAGVKRMFKTVGGVLSKMAFHMDESDRVFEEAQQEVDDMEQLLNSMMKTIDSLCSYRRELALSTDSFSKALSMLASCEENTALARALSHLTETHESISMLHSEQNDRDCAHFSEAIYEQLQLIYTMKELFYERVKVYQNWQTAQQNLTRKKEIKARFEREGRSDKVNQIKEELTNAEKQLDDMESEFKTISGTIRDEYKRYLGERKTDTRKILINVIEGLITFQKELLRQWEKFAPETRSIITN